jgi:peptidoglycan biosynthesis protein MviN/MurJ (putative lipid II flippase)
MYLLGLPAIIVNGILTRIFHSLQRLRDRIWLSAQYLLTNCLGNYLLVKHLGVMGLAVSSTVAVNLHVLLSLWVLHRYGVDLAVGRMLGIVARAYAVALLVVAGYRFTGLEGWLDGALAGSGLVAALGRGAAVFTLAAGACLVGIVLWSRWSRSRRRPA